MKAVVILLLAIGLGFQCCAFAEEKLSLQDNAIGSTFKTLAKGYVAVMDVDKFKKDAVAKINKVQPDKFKRKYAKIYESIKELPPKLKNKYGIVEDMPKEQLIRDVESLDKKKIYEFIDSVPNNIIVKEFKGYLNENKQGAKDSNLIKDINEFWNKVLAKVNQPVLKK
jgi:uncharacterized protein YdbL (DUF1318 family)